jgi:transcriptional regulator with XRE-family HTH domain
MGIGITELGDRLGIHPAQVDLWERDVEVPSPVQLRAVAEALDVGPGLLQVWQTLVRGSTAPIIEPDAEIEIILEPSARDPFVVIDGAGRAGAQPPLLPPPVPAPPPPPISPADSVFPSLSTRPHVYDQPGGRSHPRLLRALRVVATVAVLTALGVALAWAVAQLVSGLGDANPLGFAW